jgi:hypothetical protein
MKTVINVRVRREQLSFWLAEWLLVDFLQKFYFLDQLTVIYKK